MIVFGRRIGVGSILPRLARSLVQGPHLANFEPPPRAGGETSIAQRTDGSAHEAADGVPHLGQHSPPLALAPLAHHDFDEGFTRSPIDEPGAHGARGPIVQLDAVDQTTQRRRGRICIDGNHVGLLDAVPRMGEALGEVSVVGEQEQTLRRTVQPSDGMHSRLGRDERDDGWTPLGIVDRRDDALRFVEEVIDEAGAHRQTHTVDFDDRRSGIDLLADLRNVAVDGDPARSDEGFCVPPGGEPGGGDQLVDPFDGASPRSGPSSTSTTLAGGT